MHIEKKQFTESKGYGTFNNHRFYDDITEYTLILDHSLTLEDFQKILQDNEINLYGFVSFTKKLLTYANGRKQYKHIAREATC